MLVILHVPGATVGGGQRARGIHQDPVFEQREMGMLLEREGVTSEDAMHIAAGLVRYPRTFHKTMVEKELGLDRAKTNVNGGGVSIGHPLGATGARITTHLTYELRRRNARYGIGSACIGGGRPAGSGFG